VYVSFLTSPLIPTNTVLELCGGELKEISSLELLKRDDLLFEIVDDDDEGDEYDELDTVDDDDDDEYYA